MSLFALWPEPLSREQEAVANSVIALDPSITRREANRVARRPRTKKSRAALARALSGVAPRSSPEGLQRTGAPLNPREAAHPAASLFPFLLCPR